MKKVLTSCLVLILSSVLVGSVKADLTPASAISSQIQALAPKIAPPQTTTVQFGGTLGIVYSPAIIIISPGDHVIWDGDFTMHPLVSDSNLWPTVTSGSQFEFVFNTPGVYHFHCFFHGAFGMAGIVSVGVVYHSFIPEVNK